MWSWQKYLLDDGLCAARLAADELLHHLGSAVHGVLAPRDVHAAGLALRVVLVHHNVRLAGLLQRANGLSSTPDDAPHNALHSIETCDGPVMMQSARQAKGTASKPAWWHQECDTARHHKADNGAL